METVWMSVGPSGWLSSGKVMTAWMQQPCWRLPTSLTAAAAVDTGMRNSRCQSDSRPVHPGLQGSQLAAAAAAAAW